MGENELVLIGLGLGLTILVAIKLLEAGETIRRISVSMEIDRARDKDRAATEEQEEG